VHRVRLRIVRTSISQNVGLSIELKRHQRNTSDATNKEDATDTGPSGRGRRHNAGECGKGAGT